MFLKLLLIHLKQSKLKKKVQWHYGTSFAGKSCSNNSVESANNNLKIFFNRKAHNIKEFKGKIKDFLRVWSTLEKTSFPNAIEYNTKVKERALELIENASILESSYSSSFLYFTRKGIESDQIQAALEIYVRKKDLPKDVKTLLERWGFFRTIDCVNYTVVNTLSILFVST